MGKCYLCKQETEAVAMVHIGKPQSSPDGDGVTVSYDESEEYFCSECVKQYLRQDFSGIFFCLALQLSWFSVLRQGLLTSFGMVSAAIGCVGLWRLFILVKCKLVQRMSQQDSHEQSDEASDLYKSSIYKHQRELGRHVLSRREYRRIHNVS